MPSPAVVWLGNVSVSVRLTGVPVSRRAYRNPFGQNEGVRCSHVVSELLHALGSACDFMSLRTLLKLLSHSLKFSPVHQTDKITLCKNMGFVHRNRDAGPVQCGLFDCYVLSSDQEQ